LIALADFASIKGSIFDQFSSIHSYTFWFQLASILVPFGYLLVAFGCILLSLVLFRLNQAAPWRFSETVHDFLYISGTSTFQAPDFAVCGHRF